MIATRLARAQQGDAVRISPVSSFEVAGLHTNGRLRLPVPLERRLTEAVTVPGAYGLEI